MKQKEFVLLDPSTPEKCEIGTDFLLHLQKSVLHSLETRKLLNSSQLQRCLDELDRRHHGHAKQRAVQ